ncbi:CDP-diacylglycerol diphosphatase [Aureimonas phyllosphaerae]|uniref:CDP-diacylglycerol diphosphatase n=1 Tax=Aureimonas phyllosphaerae TaxID=1166078 RepID=UPI000B89C3D4|nr:CDP-diacylglycerol diphosphatase [Aureimonas phyllosphaerae]
MGLVALCLWSIGFEPVSRSALGVVVAACRANASLLSSPLPCLAVDAGRTDDDGYAILREPGTRQRTILTALAGISGIEDPRLIAANAPNFFADAWRERHWLLSPGNATVDPPNGFALGINSEFERSQDRLHIHMACLRPDVQRVLASRIVSLDLDRFAPLGFRLGGRWVWATRVDGADAMDFDPLRTLRDRMPEVKAQIGRQTLIVVRETLPTGEPTIVLLTNPASGQGRGSFAVERFIRSGCD